jgi:hypothetical protein
MMAIYDGNIHLRILDDVMNSLSILDDDANRFGRDRLDDGFVSTVGIKRRTETNKCRVSNFYQRIVDAIKVTAGDPLRCFNSLFIVPFHGITFAFMSSMIPSFLRPR